MRFTTSSDPPHMDVAMVREVRCETCKTKLRVDPRAEGTIQVCPRCRHFVDLRYGAPPLLEPAEILELPDDPAETDEADGDTRQPTPKGRVALHSVSSPEWGAPVEAYRDGTQGEGPWWQRSTGGVGCLSTFWVLIVIIIPAVHCMKAGCVWDWGTIWINFWLTLFVVFFCDLGMMGLAKAISDENARERRQWREQDHW